MLADGVRFIRHAISEHGVADARRSLTMKSQSRANSNAFWSGLCLCLAWIAIWLYLLGTPLKPFFVKMRDFGFGKHGILLGALPIVVLVFRHLVKGQKRLAGFYVLGTFIAIVVCVSILIYMWHWA